MLYQSVRLIGAVTLLVTSIFSTKTIAANAPAFASPQAIHTASPVNRMVMGDFDGDGVPDVASYGSYYDTNFIGTAKVDVHFGNGTNGFKTGAAAFTLPFFGFQGVAAADLNGDGKSELIFSLGSEVLIYGWNGTNFVQTTSIDLTATGIQARNVAVGNLTTNNSRDIIVSDDFGSVGVVWIANDGAGHFGTPTAFPTHGLAYYARPILADVNGDGLDDVIMADALAGEADHNGNGGSTAGVLLNNGNGTLSSEVFYGNPTMFATSNSTFHADFVAVADVDGDGVLDLVSECYIQDKSTFQAAYSLSVNLGNGDGTFQDGKAFAMPGRSEDIGSADFNADGKADIITVDSNDSGFTITEWSGSGAGLTVARQDNVQATIGVFYQTMTLGYTKSNGSFATFNNDTNVDVLLGTTAQFFDQTNPNTNYSQFLIFRNQTAGGTGGGGGNDLPPTTLQIVGALTPGLPVRFRATQSSTASDLTVRVQSTTTTNVESSWKELPDGNHGKLFAAGVGVYTNSTVFYPAGSAVYFRAVSSATSYTNSVSIPIGPLSIPQAQLKIGVALTSTSDAKGTLQITHIGDNLTYTFSWTNIGTLTASNLVVETPVPTYIDALSNFHVQFAQSNLTFNQFGHYVPESSPGAGDAKVYWNVSDLAANFHQSLTLVVYVGSQASLGQQIGLPNNYVVFSTTSKPAAYATGFSSGAAPISTTIRGPLSLTIIPDVTQAAPGGFINYTITISNLTSSTVSNAIIADPIPEFTHFVDFDAKAKTGTTFLSKGAPSSKSPATDSEIVAGQAKPVAVDNPLRVIGLLPLTSLPPEDQSFLAKNPLIHHPADNADQVVFYIGNLAKGASVSVRLTVQVQFIDPSDITDHEIKNFDYLGYFKDPAGNVVSSKNDSGNIFTPVAGSVVNAPDLALIKTVSAQTNTPGDKFSVILVANNRGASAAEDVFIQDRLPQGAVLRTSDANSQVVTSASSQSVLNAAISFITIGKSKSLTASQLNYYVTLDPDGTLTVHGLTLNANNGTVGLFYTLQVPADAPVPETLVCGTSFIGAGNGSRSVVGTGTNKTILSVPTGMPGEIPIQVIGDIRLFASQPISIVTQPTITPNFQATSAQLDALYAKNINATAYLKGATPTTPVTVIPGVDRFAIFYRNFGTNTASDVHVRFATPANTVFYRAEVLSLNGLIPKQFPAGQSVSAPAKLATGDVTFNVGSVPAGGGGYLMVEVLLLPGAINSTSSRVVAQQPLIYSGPTPTSLAHPAAITSDSGGTIVYDGANVPKVGIVEIVPQAVWTNDVFAVQFAAFNYGDVNLTEGCEITLQAPAGTEFVNVTGNASIISSNATSLDLTLLLVKHFANGFSVNLRATGAAGTTISLDTLVAKFPYCGTFKPAPVKVRISATFPPSTTVTTVSGAQFVTLGEMAVIPLGQYQPGVGTAIVAGPASLFGSISNAAVISDSGTGNLIVVGRASDIPLLNLPVLNSTDTKTALGKLATLVGKHGANVFNGPQGNLLAPDGESFIDNNTGSIAGTVKQMLAAGAQSVLPSGNGYYAPTVASTLPSDAAIGGGVASVNGGGFIATFSGGAINNDAHALISQDGGGLISQDGGGLISQDGGGLISQDGGGLISQDGGGLISSPASSALVNTASGNIVASGGGN